MTAGRERVWRRYLRVWRRNPREDVAEEVQFHLEIEIEELVAGGLSRADARALALAQFGDVSQAISECTASDQRRLRRYHWAQLLDAMRHEVKYILRGFTRRPSFTLTVIATLALGVGANAAVFSIVDRVFLRPPAAVEEPTELRRLYLLRGTMPGAGSRFGLPQAHAIATQVGTRFPTTIYDGGDRTLIELAGNTTRIVNADWVTPNFFRVLGVRVAAGRDFDDADLRFGEAPGSVIISWNFWQREFAGDRTAIGKTVRVRGQPMTIVGVAPRAFRGIDVDAADIWVPLNGSRSVTPGIRAPRYEDRGTSAWQLVSRVPAGESEQELPILAREAFRVELREHLSARPKSRWARDTAAIVEAGSIVAARGPAKLSQAMSIVALLAGVAALVLVIATANVGNLLLGRAIQRKRELAVRLALGMSRTRLGAQLVLESAVLGVLAAVAATVTAIWVGGALRSLLFPRTEWAGDPVDLRIALFAASIGIAGGVIAGLVPAFELLRSELNGALKSSAREGGGQRSRVRAALVAVQSALALVLLVGTGLFARSLQNIRNIHLGYDIDRVITVSPRDSIAEARLPVLAASARSLPGVLSVALTGMAPLEGRYGAVLGTVFTPEGDTLRTLGPVGAYMVVEPAYLATVGTRILRGRDLIESDRRGSAPVIVIGEEMARRVWPGQDPLGQCLRWPKRDAPCYTVVGVAEDVHGFAVVEKASPVFYVTLEQSPDRLTGDVEVGGMVVRVAGDPAPIVRQLRTALRSGNAPDVDEPVALMADVLEPQYRPWQLGARLFFGFAAIALILAMLGLYSVLAYVVTLRRHELGMRLALGATRATLMRLVVGDGLRHVAIGAGVGALIVMIAARLVSSLLYEVSPRDPAVIAVATLVLLLSACGAALLPARRAAGVDPMAALRED
ncbi:MAG: ADOP family duplicated permease [Gemmatimonadota bacterium]